MVYGHLTKGLKKFKRDVENHYKFYKTDVECFLEKLKLEGKEMVAPLKSDLRLNIYSKMKEFGSKSI